MLQNDILETHFRVDEAAVLASPADQNSVVTGTWGSTACLGLLEEFLQRMGLAAEHSLDAGSLALELSADRALDDDWLIIEVA